jgi:glycosyltransferase involved in cell wall biosynthesis
MACGCPVASSTRAALGEACGDAIVALDPESVDSIAAAVERVVGDAGLRERLRNLGLERAARYSWQAAADGHRTAYERAAAT